MVISSIYPTLKYPENFLFFMHPTLEIRGTKSQRLEGKAIVMGITGSIAAVECVKLARELSRNGRGETLYILDEPTTGLHFADIQKLLDILHRLVDGGNTVMVIEHNLDVIRTADWVIDLGPEGGEEGGYVIAEGRPEEVAMVETSYTGQFLRQALEKENPKWHTI